MNTIYGIDARYFETDRPMCQGCMVRLASDVHHKVHKQMGGRHGPAKDWIERPENKIKLCRVCHSAGHLILLTEGSFSCRTCPQVSNCYYGARLTGRSTDGLTPKW